MAESDIRPSDVIKVVLTLRARDKAAPLELREAFTVEALGVDLGGGGRAAGPIPVFDSKRYVELLGTNAEAASRMLAEFHDQAADAVAVGGATPAERLVEAVIDHLIKVGPRGQTLTRDVNSATGYVLSATEVNLQGPIVAGEDRIFRVTAVGTWGI